MRGLRRRRAARPPRLGALRRVTPIDPNWGFERGKPLDRYYIERFVGSHARDIRGRVLEIAGDDYAVQFGAGVTSVEILHARDDNPRATIIADLSDAPQIADASFDCVILTQTLMFIYDSAAALRTVNRILGPGGVLLMTVPGITRIAPIEDEFYGDWWRFTGRSALRMAQEAFPGGTATVETYGNVLTAAGLLYGLAVSDLKPEELEAHDPLYEVIVGLRAVK